MEHGTVCTAVRPVGLFHAAALDQCAGKVAVSENSSPESTAISHHLFEACFHCYYCRFRRPQAVSAPGR